MNVDVFVPSEYRKGTLRLLKWLKAPGEPVSVGESIATFENDKSTFELPSTLAGTVDALIAAEDTEVGDGAVLCRVRAQSFDLLEFFQSEAKRHAELHAAAQAGAAAARTRLPSLQTELATAKRALDDKRELMARAEKEGLDTGKLDGTLAELQSQVDAAQERSAACQSEIDRARPEARPNFDRENRLARELAEQFHTRSAVAIDDIRDCYAHLTVSVSEEDAAGRPIEVEVGIGRMRPITLRVVDGQARVSSAFRPTSLSWLPATPVAERPYVEQVHAFFDRKRYVIVLATKHYDDRHYGHRQLANSEIADSLEEHIRDRLEGVDELDLGQESVDNDLLCVIRGKVHALLSESGPFRPSEARLTSGEVATRIKDDWDAFVASPWSRAVDGALALLKYHAENGERPRFWCEDYEGHYGFRVRTRDHSWLVGQLFVMPGASPPSGKEPIQVKSTRESVVASLGRLSIKVEET